jgi:signal transduction histidine kinase/chemotaxis receptor (MCP) glutamine deamidase CheD
MPTLQGSAKFVTSGQSAVISVETGRIAVASAPTQLHCYSLGSCVAVFIFDLKQQIGGVAHIMLPSTDMYVQGDDPLKYADHAIQDLIEKIKKTTNKENRLQAKIAGGALVVEDEIDIGKQNVEAVLQKLASEKIPVLESHVGGRRSMHAIFDLTTGDMICKENEILPALFKKHRRKSTPSRSIDADAIRLQKAYLNILEDMAIDRQILEDQRIATLNILEDINEDGDNLKQRYKQLDVEKTLIRNLSYGLKMSDIFEELIVALGKVLPGQVNFAYNIPFVDPGRKSDLIYVHAKTTIGKKYLEDVKKDIVLFFDTLPPQIKERAMLAKWARGNFMFEFLEKIEINDSDIMPFSSFNAPLVVKDKILGIVNISSICEDAFTKEDIKIVGRMVDITANTIDRLQKLLKAEESGINSMVQSLSNGVAMFDLEKRVTMANPAIMQMTGLPREGFYISELTKLFKSAAAAAAAAAADRDLLLSFDNKIDQTLQSGEVTHINEVNLLRFSYEVYISPIRDHENIIIGGALIMHDITHLKEIDRMKTEFVSVASHQLRTPLTSIKLFAEMLLEEGKDLVPEQREYLNNIHESTNRMVKLVNDLLNVSRIETGRLKIEPISTNLYKFIQDIINEAKPLTEDKKCTIIFNKPCPKLAPILIDQNLMHQVIHNLITNAVRYSPKHESEIVITLKHENDGEDYALISVKDSGIGVPKKAKKRIFEKFFRAENAVKLVTEGSGLGLYVSKMITEASGGKIWLESKEGEGTTFYVKIPMVGMKKREGEKSLIDYGDKRPKLSNS